MSDRPIQVGDLVQVVRWTCCGENIGKIARVQKIDYVVDVWCVYCQRRNLGVPNADLTEGGHLVCSPLAWLKRIPPLEELEGINTDEPTKEPA